MDYVERSGKATLKFFLDHKEQVNQATDDLRQALVYTN